MPGGALRIVQFMNDSDASWQRVRVLQELSQTNLELPQILEFYSFGKQIVSVETWLEGFDLRYWIKKMRTSGRQRMGTPEAIRLFRQLAHALHHLHRHCGVIHGDIKPANIIVNHRSRRLALIDFGSAWGLGTTSRRSRGDGFSNQYSAPEILLGQKGVDFRADYFSLACVCFEVLTLSVPYEGLGSRAALPEYSKDRDSLFVPPSRLSPERTKISAKHWRAIDSLLSKSLALEPNGRHENGTDWLADWDRVQHQLRDGTKESFLARVISVLFPSRTR